MKIKLILAAAGIVAISASFAAPALADGFADGFPYGLPETRSYTVNPDYGAYDGWDLNGDGQITEEEFNLNSFSVMDTNKDGRVSEEEWAEYSNSWYEPYDLTYGEFLDYDTDGSGFIDEHEYSYVLEDTDLYAVWDYDSDGRVDIAEYSDAINVYAGYDEGSY